LFVYLFRPRYIYRFRNPEQLQAEAGYYLTNLVSTKKKYKLGSLNYYLHHQKMGAISFIETMEAKSLSISKEEFDA
jgi:hypothetical protein